MRTASRTKCAVAGFTLLELVIVVVILGVLAKFAMMKLVTPATMTLPAQAQSLADLVRRAQSLAMVRGQRMGVSVATSGANGRVAVACAASAPCNTDTSLTVSQGAVVGSASTIYFNSLGQPVNSAGAALTSDASFTLSYQTGDNNAIYTVTVAALTGRVSVSP
jgi:prepilin-type N-terminal cleavage/methylation domain-containing protein